jgi:hypothetical protein
MIFSTTSVYVFYQCNMFRPNSRSSSGTTNCIKYKGKITIALPEMRSQFYFVFVKLHYRYGLYKTVVKAENFVLLGYYAESSGNLLPTFWDNLSVPSSGFKKPFQDGTNRLSRNVDNKLPLLAA